LVPVRPPAVYEHRRLALKFQDASERVRLPEYHAGVIHQIPRGEVVGAVNDNVEISSDLERILRSQCGVESLHMHERIDIANSVSGGIELRTSDVARSMNDLSLKIGDINDVEVDESQGSNASRSEVKRGRGSKSSRSNQKDTGGFDLPLAFGANLGKHEVATIAAEFIGRELRQFGGYLIERRH